jgi:FkbM family methyltransferase
MSKTEILKTIATKSAAFVFGPRAPEFLARATAELVPILETNTKHGSINFFCPSELTLWRARSLLEKEPETIKWIESQKQNDIMWDIGANIGSYSLYAAKRGLTVVAFEPSPGNFHVLHENIKINSFENQIFAYCIALSGATKLDFLYMTDAGLGSALSSFGEAIDWQGNQFQAVSKKASLGLRIDDFIEYFNPPFPNFIKIDVDGIEDRVLTGALRTLRDTRVRSVLVELDIARQDYVQSVVKLMSDSGLSMRKIDPGQYNHIFFRD